MNRRFHGHIRTKEKTVPTALVTGGSRGIGRGIVSALAGAGFDCAINYATNASAAADVQRDVESAGRKSLAVQADISLPADRARLITQTLDHFGQLDLLVNNAGVAPSVRADMLEATEDSFDRLININLKGPYFLTQLAAKEMIRLKSAGVVPRPRIAFVTSISAYAISTNRGDYCISKSGLSMAAALWAARLAEFDIPVIEIRPGIIATDMTASVKEKYDRLIADGLLPQKRWGTPEDVARAVLAFSRGDLDYSTGVALDVSGGFQLPRL